MSQPFNDSLIRDWLFETVQISVNDSPIIIEGFHPFSQKDLDEFLKNRGFSVFNLTSQIHLPSDTVIIGRAGWSENRLQKMIDKKVGQTLRVYSQEMFLCYILTGNDPLNGSRELLDRFAKGHTALEYLSEHGFDWPSTLVFGGEGDNELDDTDWPKVGMLKHMGYRVGKSGIQKKKQRHDILIKVYTSSVLPMVKSHSYLVEWGEAGSCKRLQKIANSLASFCRNEKRMQDPSTLAIYHWETDLDWIHKKYYSGRCSFSWPSTYVD